MRPIKVYGGSDYLVTMRVGQTPTFSIYACRAYDEKEYLLKISSSTVHNGLLDREAFHLREIHREIDEISVVSKSPSGLGYRPCFPMLMETFVSAEQGNRRISVIGFTDVSRVSDLVPLSRIRAKEHRRIDLMTSAWIMGRLLKIFTFTHQYGLSVGRISGENILIEPGRHFVVFFDWTQSIHHNAPLPQEIAQDEISKAATAVILALGGNPETGVLPTSDQDEDGRYGKLLTTFANGKVSNADSAHGTFYELIRELWPRGFHPFTTYPITGEKTDG